MDPVTSKDESARRPLPARFRGWLAEELAWWESQGHITAEQGERILAGYQSPEVEAHAHRRRIVSTLTAVAAFLFGLALLLLISFNWESMPDTIKLGIIFGTVLLINGVAAWVRFGLGRREGSEALFLLAGLAYGAGIWLIAQIYHLDAHYPDAVWWWALGVFPLALILDTALVHCLVVGLLGFWAGLEVSEYSHLAPWWLGYLVPNGAYGLVLFAALGLCWSYRKGSDAGVALYVLLLVWWGCLQPFAWRAESFSILVIGGIGGLLMAIADCHRADDSRRQSYRAYGMLLIGAVLIVLGFGDFQRQFADDSVRLIPMAKWMIPAALAGLFAATCGCYLFARRQETAANGLPSSRFWHRRAVPLAIATLMPLTAAWIRLVSAEPAQWLVPTIAANAATLAFAVWMMQFWMNEDRGQLFAFAAIYLVGWSILRYIDLFGDFGGALGGAGLFALCGLMLFGLARLWGAHKEPTHA